MESMGLLQMAPMELHVAAHLHPQQSALSSRIPALPSKVDRLQPALSERTYRAAALNAHALNILSLLMECRAELCGKFAQNL